MKVKYAVHTCKKSDPVIFDHSNFKFLQDFFGGDLRAFVENVTKFSYNWEKTAKYYFKFTLRFKNLLNQQITVNCLVIKKAWNNSPFKLAKKHVT